MKNREKLKELKEQLAQMKKYNSSIWLTYGSKLYVGDMLAKEENIEKQIEQLQNEK